MKPADHRRLAAAGLDAEQIAIVMEIMEEDSEDRKAKGRARWRKHQENKKNANVSSLQPTLTANSRAGVARGEDKPLPQKIEPQESKKTDALRDVEDFKAELSPHLSADQLASIIKLRRHKRAVINGHAAQIFLAAVARCGIPVSQAADKCIERNWISIEPGWLKPAPRGSPAVVPLKDSTANAARRRIEEIQNARRTRSEIDDHQPPAGTLLSIAGRGG